MKLKKLLTKSLLVAAGLLVGASNVWADVVTQTINFFDLYAAGETTMKVDQNNVAITSNSVDYCMPTYRSANFQGRLAFARIYKGGGAYSYDEWYMRKGDSKDKNKDYGLFIQRQTGGGADFAVLDLKNGDKITFTYSDGENNIKFSATTPNITDVTKGVAVANNTEYTVNADGPLYLNIAKNAGNTGLEKIVIKTDVETAYAPQVYLKGANNLERTIEIKPGAGIAGSAATATYYTTDGTTPSNTNGTLYSDEFTVSAASTNIQAITYLASGQSKLSRVLTVTANTKLSLSASVSLTNVSAEGNYVHAVVTPTTDLSSLVGDDAATISYTFTPDGEVAETVTLTDGKYTFTKTGTFKVAASCSGYTTGEASIHFAGMYYPRVESVDFSALADASTLNGTWTADESTDAWSGWTAGTYTRYKPSANVYVDDYLYVRNVVSLVIGYGFSRSNSNEGYNRIQKLKEGEIGYVLTKSGSGGSDSYRIFLGTSSTESGYQQFSIDNKECIYKYLYYAPAPDNVSATVGANGYTTFASPYALDLTDENRPDGLKAYKATLTETTLTFTALNQTVPAGTGLLLLGETKGGTYNIPVVADGTALENDLVGVTVATPLQSTVTGGANVYYFVMKKAATAESALSFAPLSTSAAVTVPAGKAYVALDTSAGARSLTVSFGDESTGISSMQNTQSSKRDAIYNLQGQRVDAPSKGLYIIDGKKVLVK